MLNTASGQQRLAFEQQQPEGAALNLTGSWDEDEDSDLDSVLRRFLSSNKGHLPSPEVGKPPSYLVYPHACRHSPTRCCTPHSPQEQNMFPPHNEPKHPLHSHQASIDSPGPNLGHLARAQMMNMYPSQQWIADATFSQGSLHVLLHLVSCRPEPISDDVMLARLLALCQAQPHYQTGRHVVQVGRGERGRMGGVDPGAGTLLCASAQHSHPCALQYGRMVGYLEDNVVSPTSLDLSKQPGRDRLLPPPLEDCTPLVVALEELQRPGGLAVALKGEGLKQRCSVVVCMGRSVVPKCRKLQDGGSDGGCCLLHLEARDDKHLGCGVVRIMGGNEEGHYAHLASILVLPSARLAEEFNRWAYPLVLSGKGQGRATPCTFSIARAQTR